MPVPPFLLLHRNISISEVIFIGPTRRMDECSFHLFFGSDLLYLLALEFYQLSSLFHGMMGVEI